MSIAIISLGCPKILGPFKVGDGARIAANAVVLKEVPEDATAVGVPARVVRIAGEKTNFVGDVDQVSVPDPVQKELDAINSRLSWLEEYLDKKHEEAGHTEGEYCTMCGPNFCAAKLTHDLRRLK